MKALKTTLAIFLIMAAFISCSKDATSPDTSVVTPLVILPTVVKSGETVTNITYHKNAQGYIDRLEKSYADQKNIIDIAYQ